ncbi:M20/M25/M40 family metallo-hydrolase, partial [Alkalibacillus haloalkaliphilus]|uniref:M20/M25/M40 family metallo-hydrolase n=1 Tax=Alkalibacillus haloalkaliphilus TaxID=94136 RepID=UPI00037AD413
MDDIVRYLQDKEGEMVSLLRELVLIESPSSEPHLTEKMGDYLSEKFIEMTSGTYTKLPSDEYSSHIRAEWGEGERQLLIVTHFDTVWPEGTLEDMPFKIRDGKAYGPGTFDMKGGIVQALYAIQSLKDLNKHLNKKIVLMMTSDEELGSPTSKDYIMQRPKR